MNKKHYYTLIFSTLLFCTSLSATEWPGKESKWHDYQRYNFSINGKASYVVLPKRAAAGNPWVWRARFPDWHIEMDLLPNNKGIN